MPRRATLQTIADEVGVSRATVSNAYNRPDQLTPELRERILETARGLGYAGPDPAARRLRQGRAGAVGLLFTEALSYAFSDSAAVCFLEGMARRCEELGAPLLLLPLPPGGEGAETVREAVVDAICIYSMPDHHPAVDAVLERNLPTVIVDEPLVPGTTFVGVEDRAGTRDLADHLTALGHRRFGVIVPTLVPDGRRGFVDKERLAQAAYRNDRERLAGIEQALEAAGVRWADVLIYETDNREPAGADAAQELFRRGPELTALMATTDQLALGAMRAARDLGLSVPGHVSVTGYDDIHEAAVAELTTARQPLTHKGEIAGGLLQRLVRGEEVDDVILPVVPQFRGSTGPAPQLA